MGRFLATALIVSTFFAFAPLTEAAGIAFDAASSGTITSGNTTTSFNHTSTGPNLIMDMCVTQQNDASANRISASNVTYNSVSATLVNSFTNSTGDTTYAFQLIAPASGTHSVSIMRTGTSNTTLINVMTHTGASQTSQPDISATKNTTSTSLVSTLTTTMNNDWAILCVYDSDGGTATASTNATQRSAVTSYSKAFDNNADITPAGSYSMTVTRGSGVDAFSGVMVAFAPVVDPCAYSGSGDWTVKYSSNCVISSTVTLPTSAKLNILRDGAGSFGVTIGGLVQALSGAVIFRPGSNVLLDSTANGAVFNTL